MAASLYAAEAARALIILVHGYGDHRGRYQRTAEHLASRGFSVLSFDQRGHGESPGQRGHCESFEDYLVDLESACAFATSLAPTLPQILLAHSHGGLVALRGLCQGATLPPVQAAILSAPFLGIAKPVPQWKRVLAQVATRVVPRFSLDTGVSSTELTRDSEEVARLDRDSLTHGRSTARWFTEMQVAQAYVAEHIERVSVPTLWLLAGEDTISDSRVSSLLYRRCGGAKSLASYAGFYHELLNEGGQQEVMASIDAWLDGLLPRP